MDKVTYEVYPPHCCGNMRSNWKCEVREGGFISDWDWFETEAEAKEWGSNHPGTRIPAAQAEIVNMIHRWFNK